MTKSLVLLGLAAPLLAASGYKAGVARLIITPEKPIYLSGYASRNHPSEGAVHDLWAKALAIEDSKGSRVVIVTTDIIGLPRSISDVVAARIEKQYGLERARLLLNSSHTHTGPLIAGNLESMFNLAAEEKATVAEYGQRLTDSIVSVVGASLADLRPAQIATGHGVAGFGMNRREPTPKGVKIGVNPSGPTDHDVPVIRITAADGKVLAILFGYACHNTTLTGEFYKLSGDYAGFAQIEVEKLHPGTTAMYLALCGADQNPEPRSTLEIAESHGKSLAAAVESVLRGKMQPSQGPVRAAFQMTDLDFAYHTRDRYQAELADKDPYKVRRAQAMLKAYDDGRPVRRYPYPVQALALGRNFSVLALGGEVGIDYAIRVKRQYGSQGIAVAGYSNDVMGYIPSTRILKEGGYEAETSMIYYGQPGPWAENVEERIFATIAQVMGRVGRKPSGKAD